MHFKQTIRPLIQSLLDNSRQLAELLKLDQSCLKTNNIDLIENNNAKKLEINQSLLDIINQLNSDPQLAILDGNLLHQLQQYAATLPVNDSQWLSQQINALTAEIPAFNQIMQVNRTVLQASLARTRDLFCSIMNLQTSGEPSVYKPSGAPGAITISLE